MKRIHPHHLPEYAQYDILIIGGGATGLGTALDAASRGLKIILVEQADFAKGTSSRSTKLVHGGVRYLAQGDIRLVKHALEERGLLQQNANHLVHKEAFIIPCYSWFSILKYLSGLTIYDWLAGKYSFGKSKYLSKTETLKQMPGIRKKGLKGGILYYDGKFDDARLAINLVQTAVEQGATLINYMKVIGLIKDEKGSVIGVETRDELDGRSFKINAPVIINATGIFVDDILKMNNPAARNMVRPSQGVHLVLDKKFLNSDAALMIPKTPDGRVLFAVPWHNHLLVGTTDTPIQEHSLEPRALKEEVDFILNTASAYFNEPPTETDIKSVFAGLRPLAAPTHAEGDSTKEISRDHKLEISAKGLITITGGKWTTYRRMAEETVNLAISHAQLQAKPCVTKTLKIHGCTDLKDGSSLEIYGSDRIHIEKLMSDQPELNVKLHPDFHYTLAEASWCIQNEMAEKVEDVLSRRFRMLFIDAEAAKAMAPAVASMLARALNESQEWADNQIATFNTLADGYRYPPKN